LCLRMGVWGVVCLCIRLRLCVYVMCMFFCLRVCVRVWRVW